MRDLDCSGALVLTGGGTGGHYFPAVALAEGARARWPERPVLFIGARRGIEAGRLPGSGWPHLLLEVEGFHGRSPLRVARSLWKLYRAVAEVERRFRAGRPWAVLGTGGYAAAPALLAARRLGIPYFLHESNAAPGSLVKLLARRARRVWCGLDAARPLLPGADCRTVGTPVRAAFLRPFADPDGLPPPRRLLAMGGSGGARALNLALAQAAPALLDAFPDWDLLHQTGPEGLAGTHPRHRTTPFIAEVDLELEAASLVLGRAGAVTCAELRAAGRPAVLVPLPTSAGDHQRANARAMAGSGLAVMVEQGADFPERLGRALADLMASAEARRALTRSEPNRAVDLCLDDLEDLPC